MNKTISNLKKQKRWAILEERIFWVFIGIFIGYLATSVKYSILLKAIN